MKLRGHIVDVVDAKIFKGELTIEEGVISDITIAEDVPKQFIIPGFIDAHVHVESSMLVPSEFARLAVVHGTVGTVSDPHEIGNVLGKAGVRFMIENGSKTPFKFYFGAPSCVPATTFETAGAQISVEDIEEIFQWTNVTYLAEMMNFPGVLNRDPEVMAKIELAHRLGKMVDGHAPGLVGEDAARYAEVGISTDHECFTKEEALSKLRVGMKILIREGSAAKNFEALYSLIDEFPESVMFCSDDKHPNELVEGHINQLAARAVAQGCEVMNVLRACSLNPIRHYNMDVGLLQKGDLADFCIVQDLTDFNVLETYIAGEKVAEKGVTKIDSVKVEAINNFNCQPITIDQIQVKDCGKAVKVINVEDGQLITKCTSALIPSLDGFLTSDIKNDILKIVVVNRYSTSPPAVSFVKNIGLRKGAIASCVAHDSHNILAVGTNDEEICKAINHIVHRKGGISLVSKDLQLIQALPVAGIMSDQDGYEVAEVYDKMDKEAKALGSNLSAPFMTLSFCALLVIPELKLSDLGLFDGRTFSFTDVFVD